jgi:hypothetical protein
MIDQITRDGVCDAIFYTIRGVPVDPVDTALYLLQQTDLGPILGMESVPI